jgi:hypothetical protein
MLAYLATSGCTDTVDTYLETWGRELRDRVDVLTYDDLFSSRPIEAATVVFADLERLSPTERARADAAWQELAGLPQPPRLLNRPAWVLDRTQLLRVLADEGINDYRAVPLRRATRGLRFPVFVRHRSEHWGSLTPLLPDQRALDLEIARAFMLGRLDERLAVEFCDTADGEGLFRKYAAFVIDGRILPRHLIFDHAWQLKLPTLMDDAKKAEELAYLDANPHEDDLRRVAELARVDYGRFDYAIRDGRVQIWELNTNPVVMLHPDLYGDAHLAAQEWFRVRIARELGRLAEGPTVGYRWTRDGGERRARRGGRPRLLGAAVRTAPAQRVVAASAAIARPWIMARLEKQVLDGQVVEERRAGRDEDASADLPA